jgi:uncharacterized lipoprotein YddW (UPF0748 family)
MARAPWPAAIRGVWDHEGYGFAPGGWDATCAALARYGITDLYLMAATPFTTHATVPGLAPTALRKEFGDQLEQAVAAARRHGVRVHAWVVALATTGMTAGQRGEYASAGRLLVGVDGKPKDWLDPWNAANQARLRATVAYLVKNYDVDGVHLDFIRFPDFSSTLGAGVRAEFERVTGKRVGRWPEDVSRLAGSRRGEFLAFRVGVLRALVADVRMEMLAARQGLWLSAAVYGGYPLCRDSVGQDWVDWLRGGLLDHAVPMNYASGLSQYVGLLETQASYEALRSRIISGIGVTAAESMLDSHGVVEQIAATREQGLGGYVLFDLDLLLRNEILPMLGLGLNKLKF